MDGITVRVHGLGNAAYENTSAFDAAGSAETVRVGLLGNADTDTSSSKTIEGLNKKVNNLANSLQGRATIASKVGNVITLRTAVDETDGVISNDGENLELASVAATGQAADVLFRDTSGLLESRNLFDAMLEILAKVNDVIDAVSWHEF